MKNKNNNRQPIAPLLALGFATAACGGGGKSTRQLAGVGAPSASEALPGGRAKSVGGYSLLALGFAVSGCGGGGGSSSSSQAGTTGGGGNGNGGNNLPPPVVLADDIPLAIYENHPTNKAVYDAPERAEVTLAEGVADNDLFTLSDDGRIWWKASPDFEAEADSDGDGVYIIRIAHEHNDQGFTDIEVTVADLAIELTPEQWASRTNQDVDYFKYEPSQVADILPDNDFVELLLDG